MGCRLGIRSDGWCGWVAAQPDEAVFGGPPYGLCRLLVCPAGEQACDVVPVMRDGAVPAAGNTPPREKAAGQRLL